MSSSSFLSFILFHTSWRTALLRQSRKTVAMIERFRLFHPNILPNPAANLVPIKANSKGVAFASEGSVGAARGRHRVENFHLRRLLASPDPIRLTWH